jgi:hypothetical protein
MVERSGDLVSGSSGDLTKMGGHIKLDPLVNQRCGSNNMKLTILRKGSSERLMSTDIGSRADRFRSTCEQPRRVKIRPLRFSTFDSNVFIGFRRHELVR